MKKKTLALLLGLAAFLVLVAAGFAFRELIAEEWHLHKLRTGYAEEKLAAARRLGEMRSARAVPELIAEFRRECERRPDSSPESYRVFQEALVAVGQAALPDLVRAAPEAIGDLSRDDLGDAVNFARFYIFVHETITIIYLQPKPREPTGESVVYEFEELKRLFGSLRDDPAATPELRAAAVESLKAFPNE